jgi:SAM-dependent methyltransferase
MTSASDPERLRREIEHDRRISARAEAIWNWDSPAGRVRADRRASFFVEDAGLAPGRRALELGCGTGVFLERTARSGASIAGVDLSRELLSRARARVAAAANVAIFCGNAEQTPFADGTFDAVYGSSILHHLRLNAALAEALRVLRPGGRIAFTEPNIWNPQIAFMYHVGPRAFFGLSPDEMAFSRGHAVSTLAAVGFAHVVVEPFDFLHPSIPPALIARVARGGEIVERVPLVRRIAGSLRIRAQKP